MLKKFDTLKQLMDEVQGDLTITSSETSNADRYPIRFILFDNFRDCILFIEEMFKILQHLTIHRIDDWMDHEYPDTMITHKALAEMISGLIDQDPSIYRILMLFSELARFYNNEPDWAEFNSLIGTIKGYESTKEGFAQKQRIYIPIIGQEGKMQHFKNDNHSFIWYYQNPDKQQDYRLILTDQTTFGVHGLENKYTIVNSVTQWLGCWKYPELKENIISTSHSIFTHSKYAKPDNAFDYEPCYNAYDFLVKGLQLDFHGIEYRDQEASQWTQLAQMIDVSTTFNFDKFFNEQFGIHDLGNYRVFFEQWFKQKQPFMRWLLTKYYTVKFCNEGYICRVLQDIDSYTDSNFIRAIATKIFQLDNPEDYLEERRIGLKFASEYGVDIAPEVQKYLVEKIKTRAEREGILSALPYLSSSSYEEKALIINWYCCNKIDEEQLKELYPDLFYYLSKTIVSTPETWVLDYIDKYKHAKVRNQYTDEIKAYIDEKNHDELSHFMWTNQFSSTYTLMFNRQDIGQYYWIDGLGIDWIPFIQHLVEERKIDGYYLNEVYIATAKLPTRTDINKADLEKLGGVLLTKIGDIDEVAHTNSSSRSYPKFIIDDLSMLRNAINKFLDEHPNEKIAIVSDHGMTYLSQLRNGLNLSGYKSDHYGRVAERTAVGNIVKDNNYITLADNKTICALRHESLMKKIAINTGCHGGCTPEEQLVPIFVISPNEEAVKWVATQITFDLTQADPIFKVQISGINNIDTPVLEYDGTMYNLSKQANSIYVSDRIELNESATKIQLRVGLQKKEFHVNIKLAATEDDLFNFSSR